MITETYTVNCMRRGRSGETEADLENSPMRMTFGRTSSALYGSITLTGPVAEELNLGDRVQVTIEKIA